MPVVEAPVKTFPYQIGFVGVGYMGKPMVANLLRSGFKVMTYDVRKKAMEECAALGALTAQSLKQLASECGVIHVMVVDAEQLKSVTLGPQGLFEQMTRGSVLIVHSTVSPQTIHALAPSAASKGIAVLDAPVTGALPAAETATLTFTVGGEADALKKCQPIFDALGKHTFHIGGHGLGEAAKCCVGLMLHCNYLAALEAVRLARAYGIEEERMVEFAKVSTANSWVMQTWGIMDQIYENHTLTGTDQLVHLLMRKDLMDAVKAANEMKTYLPIAGLGLQVYVSMIEERRRQLEAPPRA